MSEFANFIRVAVQGLPDNTPSQRAAAYDRARKAVRRQMEARSATSDEITHKLDRLEDAILDLEAELSMEQPAETAEPDPLAAFETELTAGLAASAAGEDRDLEEALASGWAGDEISGKATAGIDIRALLRRALARQDASDPAAREIVYNRARKAVARYLRRLAPPPDYQTVHSCIEKLNEAIRETEAGAAALSKGQDEVVFSIDANELMQEIGGARMFEPEPADNSGFPDFRSALSERSMAGDAIAAEVEEALRDLMAPDLTPVARPVAAAEREPAEFADDAGENVLAGDLFIQPEFPAPDMRAAASRNSRMSPPPAYVEEPMRRGRGGLMVLALVVLLCIGGGAVAYTMPDRAAEIVGEVIAFGKGLLPSSAATTPGDTPRSGIADTAPKPEPAAPETAIASDAEKPAEPMAAAQEVAPPPAVAEAPAEPQPEPKPAAVPAKGEKAFLFQTSGTDRKPAASGSVAWSAIEVEPATGGAPDTAIRADLSIPRDGLTATITLRRNLDRSLPATHIAEIVFALADGFEGGSIRTVEGISFLQAARGASEPLIGSTVDIADGIFVFALSDAPAASPRNIQLLSHPDLIEIPVVYRNGERATLRLVAGKSGAQAFAAALKDWGVPVLPEPVAAPRPAAERIAPQAAAPEPEKPAEPEAPAAEPEAPVAQAAAPGRVVLPATGPVPVDRPLPF